VVEGITYLEIATRLAAPLLIVGANRLGTINHCALTARVARDAGLRVCAFVLSQPSAETDASASSNAEMISALTGLTCWGVLPHAASFASAAAALRVPRLDL
jgi:dethiobiotin synthetase